MNCPKCGKAISNNQNFCGGCGYDLRQMNQTPTPPPQPTSTEPGQWKEVRTYQPPQTEEGKRQPAYQPPKQMKKRKKGKGLLVLILLVLLMAAGAYGVFKMDLLSNLSVLNPAGGDKNIQITNVRLVADPKDPGTVSNTFSQVTSVTVLADLKNVKDIVDVDILWLYENDEILLDTLQYQSGDYIEYTIETMDGAFFETGSYSVVFYIDDVAVANAGFDVE